MTRIIEAAVDLVSICAFVGMIGIWAAVITGVA